ncbi:MAG TPA: FAD-dependent oxidoreductase [Gillisia sp.]|nr:FAD-dependent oxidoreductase [Gillisia sp.]
MGFKRFLYPFLFTALTGFAKETKDLVIVGGGASGTTAGIQAAKMGTKTLIIEETEWLGGMLTSAGVSAIDGNHYMASGLWGEFRQKLYDYYGGPKAVETGWVSNTLFEPSVGNKLLKEMAVHPNLDIWYNTNFLGAERVGDFWKITLIRNGKKQVIEAKLIIDATELGDVMASLGVAYDIGMDSRYETEEDMAPEKENNIIQDMTYVVVLKDYGEGADKTIPKPEKYDPEEFRCACDVSDPAGDGKAENDCFQMMKYGGLPNDMYMINWPKCGNDIYLNIIEMTPIQREEELKKAKSHTLNFLYYLQTELGYKNMGIAIGEFPTKDGLPMIPYHRESRRIEGLAKLTVSHMAKPYDQKEAYYRTGIAVGDYPIDHHHLKNPEAPEIDFVRIKIPAYNIPLGALIPKDVKGLIVAEKSISVTNIVNGATRLQPVVLGIGQAAGVLAAVSLEKKVEPRDVKIREVQQHLLNARAYLMPFIDVTPEHEYFEAIQRIGATGILKGFGVPYKWANQTWFYPDRLLSEFEMVSGLKELYPVIAQVPASGEALSLDFLAHLISQINPELSSLKILKDLDALNRSKKAFEKVLNRGTAAFIIDQYLNPFRIPVDFNGTVSKNQNEWQNNKNN